MELKKLIEFLSQVFCFKDVDDDVLAKLCSTLKYSLSSFSSGEKIYTPSEFSESVGFVVSGECTVERIKSDGTPIPLNTLFKYDSFGILAVFSCDEKFPTSVKAKKKSEVLFLSRDEMIRLVQSNPQIALNIINFMSGRISFLNDKISTFSADSVEQKLAKEIYRIYLAEHDVHFSLNCKRTAEIINSGRASLYRAIAELEAKNLIKFENKKINILNLEGLERIAK